MERGRLDGTDPQDFSDRYEHAAPQIFPTFAAFTTFCGYCLYNYGQRKPTVSTGILTKGILPTVIVYFGVDWLMRRRRIVDMQRQKYNEVYYEMYKDEMPGQRRVKFGEKMGMWSKTWRN